MKLLQLKRILKDIENVNQRVLVTVNGLFIQSDDLHLHVKDNFNLSNGIHYLETLENNFLVFGGECIKFPIVVPMDIIKINWKKELKTLDLPFNSLAVFNKLLKVYYSYDNIKINVNDEYAEFSCSKFHIILKIIYDD